MSKKTKSRTAGVGEIQRAKEIPIPPRVRKLIEQLRRKKPPTNQDTK